MIRFLKALFHQYRFVYLILGLLLFWGLKAALEMPSAIYPRLSFPRVVVVAEAGTRAPEQMVTQITRPLEEAVSTVPNVRRIRSTTIRGSTEISIDFLDGTDMDKALAQVQGRVSDARSAFTDAVDLTVERLTPGAFPVMAFNISSKSLPLADVQDLVSYQILPALRRVPGVSRVLTSGGDTREIDIEVDPQKLAQSQLTPTQIIDALQKNNKASAVGRVQQHYQQSLLITNSEMHAPEDFGNLTVTPANGQPVFLGALADIHPGIQERSNVVSGPQGPCISISILKQQDANMISVSEQVRKTLADMKATLPPSVRVTPVYDQAELVQASVSNVEEAIVIGTLLILGVLMFFLREWRTTLLAATTIPITVLLTFGVMSLFGQDFNLMSLGGIAVAIGLVIDDAIVVIENIHRHEALHPELPFAEIIHQASSELVGPVVSSTLTTIVVFLPLGLLSGVAGQFFQAFSFTLAVSVFVSLFIALSFLPLAAQRFLRASKKAHDVEAGGWIHRVESDYARLLDWVLGKPKLQLIGLSLLLVLGLVFAFALPTGFMPDMDEGAYVIDYITPPGTSLQTADGIARQIEGVLSRTPEVADWSRRTGAELGFFATEQGKGDILVRLKPKGQRSRSVLEVIASQRETLVTILPRVDFDFVQIMQDQLNDLAGAPAPIEVKVYGDHPDLLARYAQQVQDRMSKWPGVVDLKLGTQLSSPQMTIQPVPFSLAQAGLTPDDLQSQLQTGLLGTVVSQYRNGDKLIDVRLRYAPLFRQDITALPIFTPNGLPVPLSSVAKIVPEAGVAEVQRENQQRLISVEGAPEGRDLGSIQKGILAMIRQFKLPSGYRIEIGGLYASQQQAFQQLMSVLLLSILLVYAVMVFQFRSFTKPLLILSMIPLGLAGVTLVLFLTRTPLNVASLMGMILLTGLIVKNGIILIAFADQLHESGMSVANAVQEAGKTRLRPILMTTLATILGLLPLALGWGSGAELQKPLAIAVIGGLFFSTYMSLTILPWFYLKSVRTY